MSQQNNPKREKTFYKQAAESLAEFCNLMMVDSVSTESDNGEILQLSVERRQMQVDKKNKSASQTSLGGKSVTYKSKKSSKAVKKATKAEIARNSTNLDLAPPKEEKKRGPKKNSTKKEEERGPTKKEMALAKLEQESKKEREDGKKKSATKKKEIASKKATKKQNKTTN